jgi:hypothetical protein
MKLNKNDILQACIAKQTELIDGFTAKLKAMEADTSNNNVSSSQSVDCSPDKNLDRQFNMGFIVWLAPATLAVICLFSFGLYILRYINYLVSGIQNYAESL